MTYSERERRNIEAGKRCFDIVEYAVGNIPLPSEDDIYARTSTHDNGYDSAHQPSPATYSNEPYRRWSSTQHHPQDSEQALPLQGANSFTTFRPTTSTGDLSGLTYSGFLRELSPVDYSSSGPYDRPAVQPRAQTTASANYAEHLTENETGLLGQYTKEIMMFSSDGQKIPFLATLDTGTPPNWISEESLDRLRLTATYDDSNDFVNFQGQSFSSNEVVATNWYGLTSDDRKTRYTTFRVARNAPFDIIIGGDFLHAEAILPFNQKAWIMAKKDASKDEKDRMGDRKKENEQDSKKLEETRKKSSRNGGRSSLKTGRGSARDNRKK